MATAAARPAFASYQPLVRSQTSKYFAGEGTRSRSRARQVVLKRRQPPPPIERHLTPEEAFALRHDPTKNHRQRNQRVTLNVEGDPREWPEYVCARKDGSLFVQDLPKRRRVFTYLYRDLLLRYEILLAVSKDLYQTAEDWQAFRWAVKTLPVPLAGPPDAQALARVEQYYRDAPARAAERARLEQTQADRRYLGLDTPQVKLPGDPFPPPHVFYEGEPLAPVVHLAIKPIFAATSRHPMFHPSPGLPYLVDSFPKGQIVLVGFPRYDAATLSAFLQVLRRFEKKTPQDAKPERPDAPPDRSTVGRGAAKSKRLDLVGGTLYGRYLSAASVAELAAMPAIETIHGELVGTLANVAGRQLVGTLGQVASAGQQIVGVLSRAGGGDVLGKLEGYRRSLDQSGSDQS